MRVLMITSEWPTAQHPHSGIFVARQARFLAAAGIEVDVFAFRGRQNLRNYWQAWRQVQRRIRSSTYDVAHAQFGHSAILLFPKILPLVITFRGDDVLGILNDRTGKYTIKGRILQAISRFVAKRADQVIVVSEEVGQSLQIPQYHVIPSGLDLDLFKPIPQAEARRQLNVDMDCLIALFVGRTSEYRKRFFLVEEAIALVRHVFPDIQLMVAEQVPFDQVPLYMNAADVLVLTSIQEGSPNVLKEALACNLPIVAVDVGDVRVRLQGVLGTVICSDDRIETIAESIQGVLRERKRINGVSFIQDLDEVKLTEKVNRVYELAVQQSRKV